MNQYKVEVSAKSWNVPNLLRLRMTLAETQGISRMFSIPESDDAWTYFWLIEDEATAREVFSSVCGARTGGCTKLYRLEQIQILAEQ